MGRQEFSLADDNLFRLLNVVGHHTKEELRDDEALATALKQINLTYNQAEYDIEKVIGGGYWSLVFLLTHTNPQTLEKEHKVLKMLKPLPGSPVSTGCHALVDRVQQVYQQAAERFVAINLQFETECALNKKVYKESEIKTLHHKGRDFLFLFLPFLGEMSLSDLMKDPIYMNYIPLEEWLNFYATLLNKLRQFYADTGYLHNDLKPGNIVLSLRTKPNGLNYFLTTNFIDFGNAVKPHTRSVIGSLNYNSIPEHLLATIIPFKHEKTDYYGLGATLATLNAKLKPLFTDPIDKKMLRFCGRVFARMTACYPIRSSLDKAIQRIELCCQHYAQLRKQGASLPLAVQLETLLNRYQKKLTKLNQSSTCNQCFWTANKEELRNNIETINKLLHRDVDQLDVKDIQTIQKGDLGNIIRTHKFHGNLSTRFLEKERELLTQIMPRKRTISTSLRTKHGVKSGLLTN